MDTYIWPPYSHTLANGSLDLRGMYQLLSSTGSIFEVVKLDWSMATVERPRIV